MPFAKIDTSILGSSVWINRDVRDVFITCLIMAVPYQMPEPMPQLEVDSLNETGFVVPPGLYGFIAAAGPGIIHQALMPQKQGENALRKLGAPDPNSRSQEFEGRRVVRINGGFIVLNFMKWRDHDSTNAERQSRFRQRQKEAKPAANKSPRPDRRQAERDRVARAARVGLWIPPKETP